MGRPADPARFATAAALLNVATREVDALVADVPAARARIEAAPGDQLIILGAGALLHGFYGRVERALRDVLELVEGGVGSGEGWHTRLLDAAAAEVPGVRPAILRADTRRALTEVRAFRHVFRNVYALDLDPARVQPLLADLPATWAAARADFETFAAAARAISAA